MSEPTVLVTGGAGFIGSHTCKALKKNGFAPVVYDNLLTGNAGAVKWGPLEQGDIRDAARLSEIMNKYKPVAVLHFAALIQVGESVREPARYYETNVLGTYRLLEAARAIAIKAFVFSSTAAVYGLPQTRLIAEDHPKQPINPYGQTKLATEGMIRDYAVAYGFNTALLRYFNAAGADPEGELGPAYPVTSHLVPLILQTAIGERENIAVFGQDYATPDGTAQRDYVHVADLAQAHVLALQHTLAGKGDLTLNLGTNVATSVREMITTAERVTGRNIKAVMSPRRAGDPPLLAADASAARSQLGWVPKHSDIETILQTGWQWQQRLTRLGRTAVFNPEREVA
jgi:UDP-arabinose 4-epimerase